MMRGGMGVEQGLCYLGREGERIGDGSMLSRGSRDRVEGGKELGDEVKAREKKKVLVRCILGGIG
jgi:hypothetical protein